MNYCYDILCSVATDKVLSEKQGNIEKLKVEELRTKLEDETKMSKAKTREIEQLARQKKIIYSFKLTIYHNIHI